jgi:hypothetical protein
MCANGSTRGLAMAAKIAHFEILLEEDEIESTPHTRCK